MWRRTITNLARSAMGFSVESVQQIQACGIKTKGEYIRGFGYKYDNIQKDGMVGD